MNDNTLPTLTERAVAVSDELGGGNIILTMRGDHGIAPVFLRFGGIPVTAIATWFDSPTGAEKWIHNDKVSAHRWLRERGCNDATLEALAVDLDERLEGVTE